jgi:glycolate oxidase FAD binding subunit
VSVLRLSPINEAEIADAVHGAAEKGTSFEIVSGGTKRDYGRPLVADAVLDVSALSGVVKYEPEELVLTVRAATPIAEIQAVLAEKKQMLGFEPADWGPLFDAEPGRGTLAGAVATNATGARRVKAGAVRDHIIGCRFVNGKGEIIKAGGQVIKNVTGFDLPKLMCGAFGTLGVLTEITMRVSPLPERVAALTISCPAKEGLDSLREAMRLPLDVSGLAYFPNARNGDAIIRVEGTESAVEQKLAELQKRFAGHDAKVLPETDTQNAYRDISNGAAFVGAATGIWRVCVPAANAHEAFTAMGPTQWVADWAGGLLWLGLPADTETAAKLRNITARLGGHATLMRGSNDSRANLAVFEPETSTRAPLTRSVKAAFDPRRVLNPSRMFEGI